MSLRNCDRGARRIAVPLTCSPNIVCQSATRPAPVFSHPDGPGQSDEIEVDCMAAPGASRMLRLGSLRRSRVRSSVDSPAAARILAFRFSSRKSVVAPRPERTYGRRLKENWISPRTKFRVRSRPIRPTKAHRRFQRIKFRLNSRAALGELQCACGGQPVGWQLVQQLHQKSCDGS